jgi:hypothetical protein
MTMQPVSCGECGRGVLVEKFSEAHTSIQWQSSASDCPLIWAADRVLGDNGRSCTSLRKSIDSAVREHRIVESTIELPTGPSIPRLH